MVSIRLSIDTIGQLSAAAQSQGVSQAALVKRLIEAAIAMSPAPVNVPRPAVAPAPTNAMLSVRLPADDRQLLRERANGRGMPSSTYVAYLVRAHLRARAALPEAEFQLLREALREVGVLGRNFNQIARALNRGKDSRGPEAAELNRLVSALIGLRDSFQALLDANHKSWEVGLEAATLKS